MLADDFSDTTSGEIAPACAKPFFIVAIEESITIVAIDVRHARWHIVHDEPQLAFGCAQRFLRLLQPVDVVHQHESANDFTRR